MTEKIDREELERLGRDFLESSLGGPDSELSEIRERNIRAYNAEPVKEFAGPEIADRSSFVSSDVSDVVDGMIPQIIEVFVTDEKAVECEPKKPGPLAEQQAKLATGYLNHIFYVRNDGLSVLHDWLWDAATQKMGFAKIWAEEESEDSVAEYEGLTEDQASVLMADGSEITDAYQDENGLLSFSVRTEVTRMAYKIAAIAPAEMRIDRNSRYGDDPAAIGEVKLRRRFELEELGLDLDGVPDSSDHAVRAEMDLLSESSGVEQDDLHDSHKLYEYAELYIKVDADGDGVAEWVQLKMVNGTLLAHEQVDDHPYAEICLMPRPHTYFGDCPADRAYRIQKEQTNLARSIIDGIRLSTDGRTYVNMNADVNLDDLLDSRAGGIVRGLGPASDALAPIPTMPISGTAMGLQEWFASRLENRTGFTRYSQGMDANSLNKTATGISIITQKSEQKTRLMTRFAALGLRKAFQKLLKLATKHQDAEDWYRVNGEFVPVNPLEWRDMFTMRINVGLGHGTHEQKMQSLMTLQPLMQAGAGAGVVGPKHIAHSIRTAAELLGFKTAEQFCDEEPNGMPPNPQAFQQMQQQIQQQIQELTGKLQHSEQKNQALESQIKDKSLDIELKRRELEHREAEIAARAMEAQARTMLQERQQGFAESQAHAPSELAAVNQKIDWVMGLIEQLMQRQAQVEPEGMDAFIDMDVEQGMEAPAAPMEGGGEPTNGY